VTLDRVTLERVTVAIEPEPTASERSAILAALARVLAAERDGGPSAWWAAGLPDLDDQDSEP
jgi:hypothetical protein